MANYVNENEKKKRIHNLERSINFMSVFSWFWGFRHYNVFRFIFSAFMRLWLGMTCFFLHTHTAHTPAYVCILALCICVGDAGSTMSESIFPLFFSLSPHPHNHAFGHIARKSTWIFFKFRCILHALLYSCQTYRAKSRYNKTTSTQHQLNYGKENGKTKKTFWFMSW